MKAEKRKVRTSPVRVANPSEAKRAYDEIAVELDKLAPDELLTVNVDVARSVSAVLGAEPFVRSFEDEIKEQLPKHALAPIRNLRTYALAALFAHLEAQPAPRRTDLSEPLAEATRLKQTLMIAAEALAFAGLIDGDKLAEIKAGAGQIDLAADLVALGSLLSASWDLIADKTAVTEAQVERASELGTELLVALGSKDHAQNRVTPEALDRRKRAFTLLVRAYDSARQALTYLRWEEDDVDMIAPSLYAKGRRRPAPAAEGESAGGTDASAQDSDP